MEYKEVMNNFLPVLSEYRYKITQTGHMILCIVNVSAKSRDSKQSVNSCSLTKLPFVPADALGSIHNICIQERL